MATFDSQFRFTRLALVAGVFALAVGMAACGGKIPQSHYYTLESSLPSPPAAADPPVPADVVVMKFTVGTQALAQDRLVYREGAHQVSFYEYHRWVDAPAEMATQNVIDHLRRSGLFRSVRAFTGASTADYLLRGRLENLEEVDSESSVSARVALMAELVDSKSHAVVWTGRGTQETSLGERSVESLVRALNSGLNMSSEQIVRSLGSYLQQRQR